MKTTQFAEIGTDYTDDNGVLHIDGYFIERDECDEGREGIVIAYIFNKSVYYTNPEYRYDSFVKEVLKSLRIRGLVN